MALVLKDRVKETTTTAGTGTVTLAGASTGFQSFSAVGDGNSTYYTITGQGTSEWEVGIGTYTSSGTTLSRTTVLASSNSGSLVDFSAGTKDVFVTYPAGKSVNVNEASNVDLGANTLSTSATGSATTGGGQLYLNGSTSNRIDWNTNGTGAPAFTTRSAGTKLLLYPALSGSQVDYGMGIDAATLWSSIPVGSSSFYFKWYGGQTQVAVLDGTGAFTTTGTITGPALSASNGLVVNNMTIGASYSIPSGYSASSTGPVTVSSGVSVTVPSGSRWVVL